MSKDKETTSRLYEVIKENQERQAARSAKIAKLEEQKATAEKELAAAAAEYAAAKAKYDATAMIQAGTKRAQAEEVVKVISEALDAAKRENAFSYDEVTAKYSELSKINGEIVDEANAAICKLLAEIEAIVKRTEAATDDLNRVFDDINRNAGNYSKLNGGALVWNVKKAIEHARQHFSYYWPK